MNAEAPRLFVGLPLPPELAHALHTRFAPDFERAGWRVLLPVDLHITLVFLGSVAVERIGELERALRVEFEGATAIDLCFDATGAFPSAGRARVAWAGGEGLSRSTHALHLRALRAARLFVPSVDQDAGSVPWTAHATLARPPGGKRVRPPAGFLDAGVSFDGRGVELALFESRPDRPPGARYPRRFQIPLIPPPA
ncbi:MAG: hypothetical protein HZA53_14825 [Planctomycetes bacterium]|nr:hypothetical protein [Planctomycetota bacterium]